MQSASLGLINHTLRAKTGPLTQVRTHVKVYPWRTNRNARQSYLDPTRTPYTDRHNINEFRTSLKIKKPWMEVTPKEKEQRFFRYQLHEAYTSDPIEAKTTSKTRFDRFAQSVKDRGDARPTRAYNPPNNVQETIVSLYKTCQSSEESSGTELKSDDDILEINLDESRALKFKLITECIERFNHDLPSSYLNEMNTIGDLVGYYMTPVRGIDPYDNLLAIGDGLPENLALIPEAKRFDKSSDDFFGGHNALPGLICKVPGLRAAKKYPILNQDEFQWPDI